MKICKYCNNQTEDLFECNSECEKNCLVELCLDCMDLNENQCLECEKNKSEIHNKTEKVEKLNIKVEDKDKVEEKCQKCNQSNNLKNWKFENCNSKETHYKKICENCINESLYKKNKEDSCYYCSYNLIENINKIKTKFSICNENHEINICFHCYNFYQNLKVYCDICYPINSEICYFCNQKIDQNMNLNGHGCGKETKHNFKTCMDCLDYTDIISESFSCKICCNKNSKDLILFNTCLIDIFDECMLGLKIFLNKLEDQKNFDYLNCPDCYDLIFKQFYIERHKEQFEDYNTLPGSSICNYVNEKNEIIYVLTGGFSISENIIPSDQIIFIKFEKFGKSKFYLNKIFKDIKLSEPKYFHKSIKCNDSIITLGGIIIKDNFLKILDTIEILKIENYNNMKKSKKINVKMIKPRHSFSIVEKNNKIIYFGGYNEEKNIETTMEIFDIEYETVALIKFKQPLNYKLFAGSFTCKLNNNEYYILGGSSNTKKENKIVEINIEKKEFKKLNFNCLSGKFNNYSTILQSNNNKFLISINNGKNKKDLNIEKVKFGDKYEEIILEDFFYIDEEEINKKKFNINSENINFINISEIEYNLFNNN